MRKATVLSFILALILVTNLTAQNDQKKPSNSPQYFGWVVPKFQSGAGSDAANSFDMRMLRFGFKGKYDGIIGYHMMGDLVGTADNQPNLVQGWLEYYMPASLTLRVGQFKYAFSQETLPSYMTWKFANPSYASKGIGSTLGRSGSMHRDIGAQLSSKYAFSKSLQVYGSVMVMNGDGINTMDANKNKDVVVNAGVKLPLNLEAGAAYYSGTYTDNVALADLAESAMNFYLKMKSKHFTAQAEYMTGDYENVDAAETKPAGYYLQATYRVLPKFELGLRYDEFETNSNNEDTDRNRTTIGASYYFSKLNRIMLNYEMLGGQLNTNADDLITLQFYFAVN